MSNQMSWPHDEDGNPMTIIVGSVSDTVKVGENWVKIGNEIMRPVPNISDEQIINDARQVQRMAEYVVGVERFLLNAEMHGTVIPVHPMTGERFAQAPAGYDSSSMPPHPADAVNAPSVDGATKS